MKFVFGTIFGSFATLAALAAAVAFTHEVYLHWAPGDKVIQFNGTVVSVCDTECALSKIAVTR